MSAERIATLRTAEKLLRVGKIAAAIAEYTKAAREFPHDWDTAILLASLHARHGDIATAVEQYRGVAAGLSKDGQHARAATILERVLILQPGDEDTIEQLAGAAAAAGDTATACTHLLKIAEKRIGRGDLTRAIDAFERVTTLDPSRSDATSRIFELCVQSGDLRRARTYMKSARDCRALAKMLQQAGEAGEARDLLKEAYRRDSSDVATAASLARDYLREGNIEQALEFLPPPVIGEDPAVRAAFAALFLHSGRTERAIELATHLVRESGDGADRVAELACAMAADMPEAAYAVGEIAISHWVEQSAWPSAIAMLELFTGVASDHVPALIRLIEVAVDGDRLEVADRGQEMLANAYLGQGDATAGLAIAEDLAERDPLNPRYEALLHRARQLASRPGDDAVAEVVPMRAAR